MLDEFVELNRDFHHLSKGEDDAYYENFEVSVAWGLSSRIHWDDLLKEPRVVIIAEAGAGKTYEIQNITKRLRAEGKQAFFMRLEYLKDDFEMAFEGDSLGEYFEFNTWKKSAERAWFFLDSVDEAKLRDPGDFEKGLRKFELQLKNKFQQANIIITSRLTWEPKTEFSLVERLLPYHPETHSGDENKTPDNADNIENKSINTKVEEKSDEKYPKVFSLAPLNDDQIKKFSTAKGISNPKIFLGAIRRADARPFASRPQDLADLINYWKEHGSIGKRLELVKNSIKQKLIEDDPTRSQFKPLPYEKALKGAQLVAATIMLTKVSRITIPEKRHASGAIAIGDVLPDWTPVECNALLERPIFDEAIYGTVRFHHRSVREYLAARWVIQMLDTGSRTRIEKLFFRIQYGMNILTPSLRPILPWVAIFDDQLRQKALDIAPDSLLEGGDPSQFPAHMRSKILEILCQDMAISKKYHSFDISALERFSNSDIAETISRLLDQYKDNSDIRTLLLRMVWQGELSSCIEQTIQFAKNKNYEKYTRTCAIRAIESAGTISQKQQSIEYFITNEDEIDFSIIDTIIESFGFKELSVSDLLNLLDRLPDPEEFNLEGLDYTLECLIETIQLSDLETFIESISVLLKKEPYIEPTSCKLSQQYAWIISSVIKGCERLIVKKSPISLKPNTLFLLSRCSIYQRYHSVHDSNQRLDEIVPKWPELNESLLWYDVANAETDREKEVTEIWQVSFPGHYWSPDVIDFETALSWINSKAKIEEKRIALSLAFDLYVKNGRNRTQREKLKRTVSKFPELQTALQNYLNPPPITEEQKRWRRQDNYYKRRRKQREEKQIQQKKDWKIWLSENIEKILNTDGASKGIFYNSQRYLFDRLKHYNKSRNRWAYNNWKDLIDDQSIEVAEAYRTFLITAWRQFRPAVRSEGVENPNSTPYGVIFGLSGLSIEMMETPTWPLTLTHEEAKHIIRYSLWELNGFPNWLPLLHNSFPRIVENHLLKELLWELKENKGGEPYHYVLDKLAWSDGGFRYELGNAILELLYNHEPKHTESLRKLLGIVYDSEQVTDADLSKLAKKKIGQTLYDEKYVVWFTVWVSVSPKDAIGKLEQYLDQIVDKQKATEFAMKFVVNLMGDRQSSIRNVRENFKQVEHIEKLYLMTAKHVLISEDIDRAGKGVYSPGLRDNAQDARNTLFSILKQIPGKSSFLALKKIASEHPDKNARSWMQTHVKNRVEQDGDIGDWSTEDVIDFTLEQERKPNNAKQLYDLSVNRLFDLKHELENAEDSVAGTWKLESKETKLRILIAKWLRDRNTRKFSVHQEEEQADAKKPDIRTHGYGFDTPVPIELKIADNWTGNKLFERFENQLCNDYLRDYRTTYGIYLLVYRGKKHAWQNPTTKQRMNFNELVKNLQQHSQTYIQNRSEIDIVSVIGINLTVRLEPVRVKN